MPRHSEGLSDRQITYWYRRAKSQCVRCAKPAGRAYCDTCRHTNTARVRKLRGGKGVRSCSACRKPGHNRRTCEGP